MQIVKLFVIILTCTQFYANDIVRELEYIPNDIQKDLIHKRVENSHIKVFIPSIPYAYVGRLTNGSLLRVANTPEGWEFMMATGYEKIDDTTYDFTLRKSVKYQDGTPFNADSVVRNFKKFIKDPFTYTDIHNRLKDIKKIDNYKVRFYLNKPYGMFVHDLVEIYLYSNAYLDKFDLEERVKETGHNPKEAGKYGLGPYYLISGFATGLQQTPTVELKANPYYYEKGMPYIEKLTFYTQLKMDEAVAMALKGELDISPIPFNKKTEVTLSPYSKLVSSYSTNNIAIYFNLMREDGILKDEKVRIALNKAINQKTLLNSVYKKEGVVAPTDSSVNYDDIKLAVKDLKPYGSNISENEKKKLKETLNGIKLKVITQDNFMFLWKGLEYQLSQYGVSLDYVITPSEKEIYAYILTNRDTPRDWDMITWGNDDWYGNHPWNTFFTYRTSSKWSAIDKDEELQLYIDEFFTSTCKSKKFDEVVKKIVHRVYDEAYMLAVPSPNIVLAVNKEVNYTPSKVAVMPLWKAKISKYHWSVRNGKYPRSRMQPMFPRRLK